MSTIEQKLELEEAIYNKSIETIENIKEHVKLLAHYTDDLAHKILTGEYYEERDARLAREREQEARRIEQEAIQRQREANYTPEQREAIRIKRQKEEAIRKKREEEEEAIRKKRQKKADEEYMEQLYWQQFHDWDPRANNPPFGGGLGQQPQQTSLFSGTFGGPSASANPFSWEGKGGGNKNNIIEFNIMLNNIEKQLRDIIESLSKNEGSWRNGGKLPKNFTARFKKPIFKTKKKNINKSHKNGIKKKK